ncbi:RagB/SusD family nutrient uptake outer membrane protein [Roseivirga thermotolerans]|uniref:RagB/SusD family nutrient uptake outer membrane protein n=1 Tax=Roseivirga thermotolerans TaxID=1758176 RepID=UPI00273FF009|nr:RagB/SusD family nutrient uptake outer membrane protein [Roseivirga thermotolerans]
MKLIYKINIAAFLLLAVAACSDEFLELTPHQSVSNEQALTTIDDYNSSITAVYNGLSSANYYGRYFLLVPDVMSDDVKQHPSANRAKDYAEYIATVGDGIALGMWQEMWQNINALNAIINADVELPAAVEADRNHIVGEAYALRGLVYFDMVRMFAQHYTYTNDASHLGVPLVLEFDQFNEPSRNTVEEVYNQIIADMNQGISMLSNNPRTGRTSTLNNTAAKALLARVYLYKEDWANAEALATEVINSGEYTLVSNGNYLSSWSSDYSSESIFEIAMTENDNRGSDALGRMYIVEGYGDYLPSNDVVSLYSNDDVRRGWFKEDNFLTGDYAPYRVNKYPSINGTDNTKVIRLSEVYLIRAEAKANQGDNTAQADVNAIRQRADATAPPVTAVGPALLDEVLLERRKELAFEGQRLWDLMRYKQDVVRNQCTSSICTINYPNNRFILPIPEAELDANPNMQPNPGY